MGILLTMAAPASAHDPIFLEADQATPETGPLLPDGTISFALYGWIDTPGDTRGFQARFEDGDSLYVEVLIPDLEPETGLEPIDLPTATVLAPDGASFALAPEMREPFFEPFTNTRYLSLSVLETAAVAGTYSVTVTAAAPARFTVAIGTRESFFTEVERAPNRESLAGIAGRLDEWYRTPAPGVAASPVGESDLTSTSAPPSATSTTTAAEAGSALSEGNASDGSSIVLPVVGLGAVALVVAVGALLRRSRAG